MICKKTEMGNVNILEVIT